jgi:hypothetical protein
MLPSIQLADHPPDQFINLATEDGKSSGSHTSQAVKTLFTPVSREGVLAVTRLRLSYKIHLLPQPSGSASDLRSLYEAAIGNMHTPAESPPPG